ncbi:MAG: Wzz/FepE/Etk N-terminal domain-containing protein [Candidatus Buchananbacteria bacterium]|nr:Wzz/FepE/Etk N-terminal domain-containing protein [Candidatus Buchananbacteria bacterium]
MNPENIFNSKNIKTILFITIIVVIFGLVISFVQTPKYKSSAKLLVIFSQKDMNPYTSAQTSNYIAGILEEVIYSDSFIDGVLKTNFDLNNDFSFAPDKRLKQWRKMVKAKLEDNKGIITIDVYNKDKEQANNFAQAISYMLITNHSLYHGSGESVTIKMISTPSVAEKWTEPNIAQNLLLSLIAGIFAGLTFIIIFPEQELLNFLLGKKPTFRDETIVFASVNGQDENAYLEDEGYQNPSDPDKEYYNR